MSFCRRIPAARHHEELHVCQTFMPECRGCLLARGEPDLRRRINWQSVTCKCVWGCKHRARKSTHQLQIPPHAPEMSSIADEYDHRVIHGVMLEGVRIQSVATTMILTNRFDRPHHFTGRIKRHIGVVNVDQLDYFPLLPKPILHHRCHGAMRIWTMQLTSSFDTWCEHQRCLCASQTKTSRFVQCLLTASNGAGTNLSATFIIIATQRDNVIQLHLLCDVLTYDYFIIKNLFCQITGQLSHVSSAHDKQYIVLGNTIFEFGLKLFSRIKMFYLGISFCNRGH